jgi:hypothetical protein
MVAISSATVHSEGASSMAEQISVFGLDSAT